MRLGVFLTIGEEGRHVTIGIKGRECDAAKAGPSLTYIYLQKIDRQIVRVNHST